MYSANASSLITSGRRETGAVSAEVVELLVRAEALILGARSVSDVVVEPTEQYTYQCSVVTGANIASIGVDLRAVCWTTSPVFLTEAKLAEALVLVGAAVTIVAVLRVHLARVLVRLAVRDSVSIWTADLFKRISTSKMINSRQWLIIRIRSHFAAGSSP